MRSDEAAKIIEKEKRCVLTDCERPECKNCVLVMDTGEILEALDMAISALKKQEEDRWIPVTERLPEEKDAGILKKLGTNKRSDYVLATVEVEGERMTVMACTYDGKWYWNMEYAFPDYKIIAWRPLPEPYEAEEES